MIYILIGAAAAMCCYGLYAVVAAVKINREIAVLDGIMAAHVARVQAEQVDPDDQIVADWKRAHA